MGRFGPEDVAAVIGGSGYRRPADGPPGIAEGRVHSVGPAGLTFVLPDWDDGRHQFGPAPWPMSRVEPFPVGPPNHDHIETPPAKGWRCLVVFVGVGIENPWVIGVWP